MNFQRLVNELSMNHFPKIKALIDVSKPFERNQIQQKTLNALLNNPVPIDTLSDKQKAYIENMLIEIFELKGWAQP